MSKLMTEKAEQIFVSALEMEAKEDLKVFLDRACQGDDGLRAKVEDMLTLRPQLDKIFPEGGVVFDLNEGNVQCLAKAGITPFNARLGMLG